SSRAAKSASVWRSNSCSGLKEKSMVHSVARRKRRVSDSTEGGGRKQESRRSNPRGQRGLVKSDNSGRLRRALACVFGGGGRRRRIHRRQMRQVLKTAGVQIGVEPRVFDSLRTSREITAAIGVRRRFHGPLMAL